MLHTGKPTGVVVSSCISWYSLSALLVVAVTMCPVGLSYRWTALIPDFSGTIWQAGSTILPKSVQKKLSRCSLGAETLTVVATTVGNYIALLALLCELNVNSVPNNPTKPHNSCWNQAFKLLLSLKVIEVMHEFFKTYFPWRSSFELPEGRLNQYQYIDDMIAAKRVCPATNNGGFGPWEPKFDHTSHPQNCQFSMKLNIAQCTVHSAAVVLHHACAQIRLQGVCGNRSSTFFPMNLTPSHTPV